MAQFNSKIDCRYGAPMGQRGTKKSPCGRVRCFKVNLNSGGYADNGVYWGSGPPALYCADDDNGFQEFVRAESRDIAMLLFKLKHPDVVFKVMYRRPPTK